MHGIYSVVHTVTGNIFRIERVYTGKPTSGYLLLLVERNLMG